MVSGITLIKLALICLFSIQAIGQFLIWLYWLQVKEYRFDRFIIFLKSSEGKRELLLLPIIVKLLTLIVSSLVHPLFLLLYFFEALLLTGFFVITFFQKKLRRPVVTQRVNRITLITLFLILLTIPFYYPEVWLIVLELCVLLGPLIGIYITGFSVKNTKEKEKKFASEKLRKYAPTVIGITGSYGKTTTKDFISQILSSKYKVLSSYKNQNTHFGILRRINNGLKKEHKFFIAEIGAYKRGEIIEIAEILKPKAAFITGIEPQHLELFGSLENLKKAKFELIDALDEGGLAFFNATDNEVVGLSVKAKSIKKGINIYTYAVNKKGKYNASTQIENSGPSSTVFSILIDGEKRVIKTNLISQNLIENLTGAIIAARIYGVDWPEIVKTCRKLKLPESTLNVFKTGNGITVIDDSYNTSPSGFESALEILGKIRGGKKFVATTGIIELGKESYQVHKNISKILNKVSDVTLLRNKDFEKPLKEEMDDKGKIILIRDSNEIIKYFKKYVKKDDVVLLEGKLPLVSKYFKSL